MGQLKAICNRVRVEIAVRWIPNEFQRQKPLMLNNSGHHVR
jgi:hypothetical protein